jgi:hypothetical protein
VAFKLMAAGGRDFARNSESIQASDVFNQCDLKWSITRGVLKEDIILKNLSAPKSFEYLIRIRNVTIAKDKDGSYVFNNGKGKTIFIKYFT